MVYYVKGRDNFPEEVRKALLSKYPDAIVINMLFADTTKYYYVNPKTNIVECTSDESKKRLLETLGEELKPIVRTYKEKTLYAPLIRFSDGTTTQGCYYSTPEEALSQKVNGCIDGYVVTKVYI